VYIDNGDTGDSGELKIDVDGHEFTEQENFSTGSDGVLDSYEVDTAGGDHLVYTDTDHDGVADEVTELDPNGQVIEQAHFDAGAGHWVNQNGGAGAEPGSPQTEAGHSGGAESINVDTAGGDVNLGAATVDSNNDGAPDTVVVHDANGDTILYTDANGDGQADVATEITSDGHVVTADHTGDHQWTEVETGHLDSAGTYHEDSTEDAPFDPQVGAGGGSSNVTDAASDEHWGLGGNVDHASGGGSASSAWHGVFGSNGSASGVVRIDSTTGQWISQN
jgi:hypothetical protein